MWVLVRNICKRERKGKRRKEKKREDKGITTLGSCNDDDGWCSPPVAGTHTWLFAVASFIVQSPPSVPPLEDFYGACSRKYEIFCAGASGGGGHEEYLRWS